MTYEPFIIIIISYLTGSIPVGYLIGKIKKFDIRKYGSGNIGAANIGRSLGARFGLLTFFIDALKAFLLVFSIKYYFNSDLLTALSAFFVVFGNIFSIFLRFKGGKGFSHLSGAVLAINPILWSIGLLSYLIVLFLGKYSSLANLVSLFVMLLLFLALENVLAYRIFIIAIAFLIILTHSKNIYALIRGEERKLF